MTDARSGRWVSTPDNLPAWKQSDGSLWRQAPDGTWMQVPALPSTQAGSASLRRVPLSPARWAVLVGLIAGAMGLLLPWATAFIASVTGLDSGDGKLFGGMLLAAIVFGFLRLRQGRKVFAVLLLLCCLAMAGIALYDLIQIWTSEAGPFGISAHPGSGLYLDAVAGLVASIGSIGELRTHSPAITAPAIPARSRRRFWLIVGVVAAVVVGGSAAAVVTLSGRSSTSPATVVSNYLNDLAKHDAAAALKLGPTPPSATLLTDEILAKQQAIAPISNVKTGQAETTGNDAQVPVTYQFGSKTVDIDLSLRKTSGTWKLTATAVEIDLSVSSMTQQPPLTVFGIPVAATTIYVFPGPLQFASANSDFTVTDTHSSEFATSPDDTASPELETSLSVAGTKKVTTAVTTKLATCAKSTTLEPASCPQSTFAIGELVPGTVAWTTTSPLRDPRTTISYEKLTTVDVSGEVDWAVSYRVKDFDGTVTTGKETTTSSINGTVDLSQPVPVLTLS